ncbi:MAG: hypothetical protein IMZ55_11610, partial [Acidobacteria bacterium]|nr:hypothetical protein [Acidobacteriota bacterium]
QDLNVGVPVDRHAGVKQRLPDLLVDFQLSSDEPSIWVPRSPDLLEAECLALTPFTPTAKEPAGPGAHEAARRSDHPAQP